MYLSSIKSFSPIAHWYIGGQKVVPQKKQAKSITKRFGQIYLENTTKIRLEFLRSWGIRALRLKTLFSSAHPCFVKSKNAFFHFVKIFMGILEICEPTF